MKSFVSDNLTLKLFSLMLGFTFWYAVARESGVELAFSIPFELQDVPEGLEVVAESVQQVDVRLRGPAEILRGISAQDLSVAVDLSDAEPGERIAYLTPEDVAVPFGVRVMRVTPSSLRIELDRTMRRTVNVIPRILGAPAEGFELQNIALSPQAVTVVGPASQVRGLEQVTTEPVSADGLRQPFSRAVGLELHPLVRLESGTSIELTLDVREVRLRKEISEIEVTTRPEAVRASLEPNSVRVVVEGPRSMIEQLRAGDLEVEVRLDGLGAGRHKVVPIVHVIRPDELAAVHIVSVTPNELTVQVQ